MDSELTSSAIESFTLSASVSRPVTSASSAEKVHEKVTAPSDFNVKQKAKPKEVKRRFTDAAKGQSDHATAREGGELAGRHAHRPGAVQRVFHGDLRLAPERGRHGVERPGPAHLVGHADLEMVLEVAADLRALVVGELTDHGSEGALVLREEQPVIAPARTSVDAISAFFKTNSPYVVAWPSWPRALYPNQLYITISMKKNKYVQSFLSL